MRVPLLPTALAVLLLAGCTGTADDDSGASSDTAGGGASVAAPAAPEQAAAGDASGPGLVSAAVLPGDQLVRTADLTVAVDDVRAAADRAGRVARDAGGLVGSERTEGTGDDLWSQLVLRVPPDRFDEVLRVLSDLGEEKQRSVGTEDVGGELVDLETRLAAQRASVERVRALLAEADDIAQVVQIESELTRRTADLESLEARLAVLRDKVQLSGISLRLERHEDAPATAAGGAPGFLDGLRGGWDALLAVGRVAAATVGALLPFVPLLVLGLLGARWLRRRQPA